MCMYMPDVYVRPNAICAHVCLRFPARVTHLPAVAVAAVCEFATFNILILTKVSIVVLVKTGFQVPASLILASREYIRILEINAVPARVGQHTPCESAVGHFGIKSVA